MESERMEKEIPFRPVKITSNECKLLNFGLFPRAAAECRKETIMNKMYDAVMKMETLLDAYEALIGDMTDFLNDNGIDITGDPSEHPALMLYAEAGRIYGRLLHTRKIEDLLRMEGEYRLMTSMVAEMKAGAWMTTSHHEKIAKAG